MAKKIRSFNWLKVIAVILGIIVVVMVTFSIFNGTKIKSYPKVALVHLEGPIMISKTSSTLFGTTGTTAGILNDLKKIKEDSSIKAVIIEINSPGGAVVASQEVANAVNEIGKPSIAVIREVGASGGYWVASAADMIVASELSITGSIGVISSYLEFSGLMDRYGVDYERLVAGQRKDLGTPYRDLSSEEKAVLQSKLNIIHEHFINDVARNRNLDVEKVKKVATGEFYLGSEALELGLVDRLGNTNDATEIIKQKLNAEKITLVEFKHERGVLDLFTSGAYTLGLGIGDALANVDEEFGLRV